MNFPCKVGLRKRGIGVLYQMKMFANLPRLEWVDRHEENIVHIDERF